MSNRASLVNRRSRRESGMMFALVPVINERTGRLEIQCISWNVSPADLPFAHLYDKAHALMPGPAVPPLNATWNPERIESACAELGRPDGNENRLLRAIGILGHSPCPDALEALEKFGRTTHALAPVARLAGCECAALYRQRTSGTAVA